MEFLKLKHHVKHRAFALTMRCFGDFFEEKNINVDVFDDVLQNAKHWANDASNDVNRPPLVSARLEIEQDLGLPRQLDLGQSTIG